jgi:acid stress chaperone HdeB
MYHPPAGWCRCTGGFMKIVAAAIVAAALSATPALAEQSLPLSTMTCKAFVESPKETIGVILTWLLGYIHDHDEPAAIDFDKMADLGKKLGTYCGTNPTHSLMTAVDKVAD